MHDIGVSTVQATASCQSIACKLQLTGLVTESLQAAVLGATQTFKACRCTNTADSNNNKHRRHGARLWKPAHFGRLRPPEGVGLSEAGSTPGEGVAA